MFEQKFGIEIEMTGITRQQAAEVIAAYFQKSYSYEGGIYDAYHIEDNKRRVWKIVSDSSITPERKSGSEIQHGDYSERVELVSPICQYEDIKAIQEIVHKLEQKDAFVNDTTGIHIHVDALPYDANSLKNLVNIMRSKEDLLYKALQVEVCRIGNYCKKTEDDLIKEVNQKKPKTREAFQNIWYEGYVQRRTDHYHESRYHGLNLHSVFQKGTVEFRLFNSTLEGERIKSYIQLCLAISHQALTQRSARSVRTQSTNEKYTFRTWLLRLGMIGKEFESARRCLLEHLDGNIAWKEESQAQRQKERLAQRHLEQQNQQMEQTMSFEEEFEVRGNEISF